MDKSFFDQHTHSVLKNEKRYVWKIKRLWLLAQDLPLVDYPVSSFDQLNEDIWFCGRIKPTISHVMDHFKRIQNADLSYPIILSQEGIVMDGIHRILKARVEGLLTVKAVQFKINPEPDLVE